jgi:transglutaminase-like putative cysteine protease
LTRLQSTFVLFSANKPIQDPLLFLVGMALLFWTTSITCGYLLIRDGKPWIPLFISGVALITIDYYHYLSSRAWFDGGFLLFSLLLVSRVYFLHSRKQWEERGAVVDPEAGLNLGSTVLVIGLIMILFAWSAPFLVDVFQPRTEIRERMSIFWSGFRNRLGNTVAGLGGKPVNEITSLSNQVGLGTGNALGDDLVLTISASSYRPEGKRYYWRGYSYNHYAYGYWRSTQELSEIVAPREWKNEYPIWQGRTHIVFSFIPESSLQRTIFAPVIPDSANRTSRVVLANTIETQDIISLQADTPLQPGEKFDVEAWVSIPTVAQLRASDTNYPEWVTERYLDLPDNLPPRIKKLAETITSGQPTTYDSVMAITEYLRRTITFQEIIPSPPSDREPIDWFLFDYKKGFCNYYATAEVLMLRSLGIPARLAIGYAEGEGNATGDIFKVKVKDSHAWPEVFFTNAGWVEFEPTASQPNTELIPGDGNTDSSQNPDDSLNPKRRFESGMPALPPLDTNSQNIPSKTNRFWIYGIYFAIFAAAAAIIWGFKKASQHWHFDPLPVISANFLRQRGIAVPAWIDHWAWYTQLTSIEWEYVQMGWMLRLMGKSPLPGQTPSERAALLVRTLPDLRTPVEYFLEEYHLAEYSHHPVNLSKARQAFLLIWKQVISVTIHRFMRL